MWIRERIRKYLIKKFHIKEIQIVEWDKLELPDVCLIEGEIPVIPSLKIKGIVFENELYRRVINDR